MDAEVVQKDVLSQESEDIDGDIEHGEEHLRGRAGRNQLADLRVQSFDHSNGAA